MPIRTVAESLADLVQSLSHDINFSIASGDKDTRRLSILDPHNCGIVAGIIVNILMYMQASWKCFDEKRCTFFPSLNPSITLSKV